MSPRSVTNGEMLRARFGRKLKRVESIGLLVAATDLPGEEWFQRGQMVWRMGVLKPVTPWFERAGKAGNFTAFRSFEQPSTQTWFASQVIPLVSEGDALLAVSAWSTEDMWANGTFQGTLMSEHEIHGETLPGLDGGDCCTFS